MTFTVPLNFGADSSCCISNFFSASMARIFSGGGIRFPFKFLGNINIANDAKPIHDDTRSKPVETT